MCVLLPCTTNEIGIPLMPLTTFCTNYVCFFLIEMTFVNVSKVALFALLVDIVVAIGVAVPFHNETLTINGFPMWL